MSRGYTDYPRQGRFPHMAPIMGAVPIFGPRYTGVPTRPLGSVDDPDANTNPPSDVTPSSVTDPTGAASSELAMGAATAAIGGAVVGGVAGGDWRGAGIGAGMNVGVWSALTVIGHWDELTPGSKGLLAGAAAIGIISSAALVMTRTKR